MSALSTGVRAGTPAKRTAHTYRPARRGALAASALFACAIGVAEAQISVTVATEAELRQAILDANAAAPGSTIRLGGDVVLTQSLPMIRTTLTVVGDGHTIDANDSGRAFFVQSGTVTIQDVTVANALARGGAGGSAGADSGGGGGGLGAGAALFVDAGGNVSVSNFTVVGAQAVGGAGGAGGVAGLSGAGGGGGLNGAGGTGGAGNTGGPGAGGGYSGAGGAGGTNLGAGGGGGEFATGGAGAGGAGGGHGGGGGRSGAGGAGGIGGGGGGGGATASGSNGDLVTGGAGGGAEGGAGGNAGASGSAASAHGGGGGAGSGLGTSGGAGGVSGGGGGGVTGGFGGVGGGGGGGSSAGGVGGDFGGGGGGPSSGGAGGFGGGGGGSSLGSGTGGSGGFGAGGGSGATAGAGGSFGGAGGTAGGGGGAALGGAIFVRAGGTLTITDGAFTGSFGVTGGSAGGTADGSTAGQALGTVFFLDGASGAATTTIAVATGKTVTIAGTDAIAGSGGLINGGPGTLVLGSANVNYSGGVTLSTGTVAVGDDRALGLGTLTSDGGAISASGGARIVSNAVALSAGGMTVNGADDLTLSGVISGSGALTKTDGFALTLSGANTYTGGTLLNAGTVSVGNDGNLGGTAGRLVFDGGALRTTAGITSGRAITLEVGGGTVETAGNDSTLSGVISGAGALTKVGAGTLTLSGANTYAGGTTVSVGTLQGDATSLQGTITNNAQVVFDQAVDGIYAGVMSGAGALTKTGAWTLTLSGGNTYTGGTTVSAGTVRMGAAGSLPGAGAVVVNGGATLDLNGTSQSVGSLAGAGDVLLGAGMLTVGDDNTSTTFSGVMSGTGGLGKAGTGTLTLSGGNTYTGGTTVSAGTVRMGAGGSLPGAGAVVVNGGATLDLNGTSQSVGSLAGAGDVLLGAGMLTVGDDNTSTTFSGVMSGTGGLTKQGSGIFTLPGANSYTGTTSVVGGTLLVNGSLAGSVTVGSGGLLGGTGSIGGDVTANGRLAPGASIGTITIDGDLTFGAGAIYEVEVNAAGQSDLTDVTGTATLTGARVVVVPAPGVYRPARQYTILTATAGIVGVFSGVSSSLAFLVPTVSYDPTNVFLALLQSRSFTSAGRTANQRAVGAALDAVQPGAPGDLATLINELFVLTVPEARNAFDRLSGEAHATAQTVRLEGSRRWTGLARQRLVTLRAGLPGGAASVGRYYAEAPAAFPLEEAPVDSATDLVGQPPREPDPRRDGWWIRGYGGGGDLDDDGNAAGARYHLAGTGVGADLALPRDLWLGMSAGYAQTGVRVDQRRHETTIDSYQAALYGGYGREAWIADGFIGYAFNAFETTREVLVGAVDRRARAAYEGFEITAAGDVGYAAALGGLRLEPRLGVAYIRLRQEGFTEQGADAANLVVDATTVDSLGASVGLRAGWPLPPFPGGVTLVPTGRVRYTRELLDDAAVIAARLAGAAGARFHVRGLETARDRVEIGAGLQATVGSRVGLALDYTAEIAVGRTAHFGSATINLAW